MTITETDAIRENPIGAAVITGVTLGLCAIGYEIFSRIAPWMIGKPRNSKTDFSFPQKA